MFPLTKWRRDITQSSLLTLPDNWWDDRICVAMEVNRCKSTAANKDDTGKSPMLTTPQRPDSLSIFPTKHVALRSFLLLLCTRRISKTYRYRPNHRIQQCRHDHQYFKFISDNLLLFTTFLPCYPTFRIPTQDADEAAEVMVQKKKHPHKHRWHPDASPFPTITSPSIIVTPPPLLSS
jgi:hypothetical protein